MTDSTRSGTEAGGLLSRREAIAGALAVAAGTLFAVSPPVAMADNGDPVLAGRSNYSSAGTTVYLNNPPNITGLEYAQAMINRNGIAGDGPVAAFGGVAMPAAIAGSTGIWGDAWAVGHYGVHARHENGAGVALKVQGKATFSRSGKATITKGRSTRTLTGLNNIGTGSMILVTLQGSAGTGRYVRYAKRLSDTSFRVVLNKASAYTVTFAWIIVD